MLEFVQQYFTSVIGALSIMSTAYFLFWVVLGKKLSNRKVQLSKRAGWRQIKGEIGATLLSFIGSSVFVVVILSFKDSNLTKFYIETGKNGMWYEIFVVLIMVVISDTWFYWSHRAMHHRSIYKYVHALHHKSLDVNPYTSTSFHVIESVWLTAWILPLAMAMPISMTALGVVQVIGIFNNLKSHLGHELFPGFFSRVPPFNMLVTATNHSLHHTQYNGNYALFFRFWDIVCGTELNTTQSTFDDIQKRKNAQIVDNSKYRILEIDDIVKENHNTVSIYFRPKDHQFYDYTAGQYLTFKVTIYGKTYNRCFSLSSSPQLDDFLRITVKLKGEVSHYLYHRAKVGDKIQSLLPVGEFIFKPNSNQHYVLVAGGSGITAIYSILRQLLRFEPNNKITLLYANRTEDDIIFRKELIELAERYKQLKYIDFISGKKRIKLDDLKSDKEATYFICGPDTLKSTVINDLKKLNVNKTKVNVENFADGYVRWFGLLQSN